MKIHANDYMIATFMNGPIKPCKGCRHFDKAVLNNYCMYQGSYTTYIDEISGDRIGTRIGAIKAEHMRSTQGLCKPERKLYETFSGVLWKILKKFITGK